MFASAEMEDTVLAIAAALFLGLLAVLYYCVTSAVVPKALDPEKKVRRAGQHARAGETWQRLRRRPRARRAGRARRATTRPRPCTAPGIASRRPPARGAPAAFIGAR